MLVIKQFGPVTYAMGTLQEILAGTGIAAKVRALPNDVAGCTLEMGADGKWVGTLGSLSKATADALYASGALANLATGATYRGTSGTQYTYSAGWGWGSAMRAGVVGLLGDSLTDKYSSAPTLALASVGRLIINRAQSGSTIAGQTDAKLDGLAACRDIYIQVGTNDIFANSITTIYSRYLDLFNRIKARGHRLFVTLIPYASTYYSGTALANLAAFYAAKDAFADGVFDPYTEFMKADGTASYASADGVHPSNSAKATIAAVYSAKIKGLIFAQPQVRYNTESLLRNGCFLTDSNADGLADSWVSTTYGTVTGTATSLSSADSAGYKKQQISLTAMTGAATFSVYQEITGGFVAGNLMRCQALIEANIPDAYDDNIWAMLTLSFRDSGGTVLATSNPSELYNRTSVTAAGPIMQSWDLVVPENTASARLSLSLRSVNGSTTISSLCSAAFSRAGLYNLTSAGIPASSAIMKSY